LASELATCAAARSLQLDPLLAALRPDPKCYFMSVHGGAHVSSMRQILGSVGFGRACGSYKTPRENFLRQRL